MYCSKTLLSLYSHSRFTDLFHSPPSSFPEALHKAVNIKSHFHALFNPLSIVLKTTELLRLQVVIYGECIFSSGSLNNIVGLLGAVVSTSVNRRINHPDSTSTGWQINYSASSNLIKAEQVLSSCSN